MSPTRSNSIPATWNATRTAFDEQGLCLPEIVEQQAQRTPDRVAASYEGKSLTYAELMARADRRAAQLIDLGVAQNSLVGVYCERSLEMLVGLLAILRAGGAYVPIDPTYPGGRVDYMLEDSGVDVLLAQTPLIPQLPQFDGKAISLDVNLEASSVQASLPHAGLDDLAYVIYTSGSTGKPKGAMNTHRAVCNRLLWMRREFQVTPSDVFLQKTPFSFDVSVWEFFLPLISGARLVFARPEGHKDARYLAELIQREGITILHFVPSMLDTFLDVRGLDELCSSVRDVACSGEELTAAQRDRFHRLLRANLHNLYGPTEAAVDVTHWRCRRDDHSERVPIGRPVANTQIHLLDEAGAPVGVGETGELYIGGVQVGQGYHNRPDLTAERFIADPFSDDSDARLYRTGDLARWTEAGAIEFLGRIDNQVKIRGNRIELGEVESALRAVEGVTQAAVIAVSRNAVQQLVGFYVSTDGQPIANDLMRAQLADTLPDYMLPSRLIHLPELPLTPSGKLDRQSLQNQQQTSRPELSTPFVAPSDDLERFIAGRWEEILGIERVGVNDPFFELGGDSLTAAQFIREMQEELNEFIYVVAIFSAPTVARMASLLRAEYQAATARRFGKPSEKRTVVGHKKNGTAVVDDAMIEEFETLIYRLGRSEEGDEGARNARAMFILAPPRSGTTLLRVMLAGHPEIFASSELQLLGFHTLAERKAAYAGRYRLWLEGTVRAVKEIKGCSTEEAWELMSGFERQGLSTRAFYGKLQQWLQGRILLDKSPSYALDPQSLIKAETDFESPFYIHLVRHPEAMMRSFEDYHMHQVLFLREHSFSSRELAELVWSVSHRNILQFLTDVAPERQIRLMFEGLVAEPEETMKEVCQAAGLSYHAAMSRPYDDLGGRMTDGLHENSIPMGDTKLLERKAIDPTAADSWKDYAGTRRLGELTQTLAASFGYQLEGGAQEQRATAGSGSQSRRDYLAQLRDRRGRSVK